MLEGYRYQMVELIFTVQQAMADIYFQNQPQLQSVIGGQTVYIRAITTYSNNALTTSPLTSGSPVATPADIQNAVITLDVLGTESLRKIPLADLNRTWADPGAYTPFVIQPLLLKDMFGINWTKSYVTTPAALAATPISFLFGVWYEYSTDPKLTP